MLDPPRSGAGKGGRRRRSPRLRPAQIVYVACDPVALARDIADCFAERGYELAALRAFDLFPNTHHVEAVGGPRSGVNGSGSPGSLTRYDGARAYRRPHWRRPDERG